MLTFPTMNPPVTRADCTRLPGVAQAPGTLHTLQIAIPTGNRYPVHLGGPLAGMAECRHYVAFWAPGQEPTIYPRGALQKNPEDRAAVIWAIVEARV